MEELSTSDCHFIRCLKPNEIKKPEIINASYCLLQIKYLGILESIKVRKEGFPYRKDYKYLH
jgi:myosin heavy subunit